MKRFITYLYEYRDGKKGKNVGFLRVDIRGDLVNAEIIIRNYMHTDTVGVVYGLFRIGEVQAMEWTTVRLSGGQCRQKFVFKKEESGHCAIEEALGIAVVFEEDGYLASCWDDKYIDEISKRQFRFIIKEDIHEDEETEVKSCQVEEKENPFIGTRIRYKKIDPDQIRDFPTANWELLENSFLKHGVYNYGFLFLKKEEDENGEHIWLGVPGYYEKQEYLMASLFGFPEFVEIPKTIVDMEMNIESVFSNIEKNQEPKTGIFGGWFVLLDK